MGLLAKAVQSSLKQACQVEPFDVTQGTEGYDELGQPLYGAPRAAACRITPKMMRTAGLNGDTHTAVGTVIILAADDPVGDRDRITLPDHPDRGPIIAQVTTYVDLQGHATHKEVVI